MFRCVPLAVCKVERCTRFLYSYVRIRRRVFVVASDCVVVLFLSRGTIEVSRLPRPRPLLLDCRLGVAAMRYGTYVCHTFVSTPCSHAFWLAYDLAESFQLQNVAYSCSCTTTVGSSRGNARRLGVAPCLVKAFVMLA